LEEWHLDINQVKSIVEKQFKLHVNAIEKVKNVYKLSTDKGPFCLKVIKYEFPHFLFIISAIKYLNEKGFKKIPK
jgi:hypothetical protein